MSGQYKSDQDMKSWSHYQLMNRIEKLQAELKSSKEISRLMGNANHDLKIENEKLQDELERVKGITKSVCEKYGALGNFNYKTPNDTTIGFGFDIYLDSEILRKDKPRASGKFARECMKELGNEY